MILTKSPVVVFQVHGHPEPQVTWYKEGRPVIGEERCVVAQSGRGTFSLVVGGVTAEDLGCYTCQATNQAGSRQVTVEILLEGLKLNMQYLYSTLILRLNSFLYCSFKIV